MKKRILALLLGAAMALSLAACGQSVGGDTAPAAPAPTEGTTEAAPTDAAPADEAMAVGFIYIGDDSEAYTRNFIAAQTAIDETYGSAVKTIAKYGVSEDASEVTSAADELIAAGCKIIFSCSYGFENPLAEVAAANPDVFFCQATGDNAVAVDLPNYANYMGEIYQGRYVAGIIAGMKLQELIDAGTITQDQAKVGYVAAFNFAEPVSGYTAFYMGIASVVGDVAMEIMYANSWGDYEVEKQLATAMIEDGCVIISQHSDTAGPAEACEEAAANGATVFHVGYNDSMLDIAPNTSLGGSRINWAPFEVAAVGAILNGETLADAIVATGATANATNNDFWGGFGQDWVAMLDLNTAVAAEGTAEAVDAAIAAFADGSVTGADIFAGSYTATNPFAADDKIDLAAAPFAENGERSAPAFGYVLDNFIVK